MKIFKQQTNFGSRWLIQLDLQKKKKILNMRTTYYKDVVHWWGKFPSDVL